MSDAKNLIIEKMNLERRFGRDWISHHLPETFVEQLLACKDDASRRLLLGISHKEDHPAQVPAFLKTGKRKPPQNQPLPRERKTACTSS